FLAGDGENYDVMPGGLTRVAGQAEDPLITGQSGAWSKDTWVLRKSGSMRDVLRLHRGTHGSHAAAELTSRAAENLFWAASYLQRSESLLRATTAYQNRYDSWLDYNLETDRRVLEQWLAVLSIYIPELTGTEPAPDTLRRAMLSGKAGSLVWNLRRAIEGVYTVRDFWPLDSWRVIEELEELIGYAERNVEVVALDHLVHRLLTPMLAFWAASQEGLAQMQGGLWLQLGRRLERVQNMVASVVAVSRQLGDGEESLAPETLLLAHGCMVGHRRRYGMELNYFTAWQYLLLDATNPRSLLFQLQELESLLHLLNQSPQLGLSDAEKILLGVVTQMKLADAREWVGADNARGILSRFLGELNGRLRQLGNDLDHLYFRHTQPITQFAR